MSTEVEERVEEPAGHEATPSPTREALRDRVLLPLALPIVACVAVVLYALNVSRVFLASHGSTSVVAATTITALILIGAASLSAARRMRPAHMLLVLCSVFLVVMLAGALVLGHAEPEKKEATGYQEPAGPSIFTLEVDALATLKFQATQFTAPAGIVTINYKDVGSITHTLAFREAKYAGFLLRVQSDGEVDSAKVDLTAGQYQIYCTIPGHAQAGMEATLTVTGSAGTTPTTGAAAGSQAGTAPASSATKGS